MEFEDFLKTKGEEYKEFDSSRAPRLFKALKLSVHTKIISIIGTNGKGSTGRFLAQMLYANHKNVGHFTSPHLLSLNERFWKNGENLSLDRLNQAFLTLDKEILKEASYFEVLTFLAFKVFEDCDFLVLEAGLGGEFDSTTTCTKGDLSLFTSISLDHQDLLGDTLTQIATTKLNAMCDEAILGINSKEVQDLAKKIAKQKGANLEILENIPQKIQDYCHKMQYPNYQKENLSLAYRALQKLGFTCDLDSLCRLSLQGRMQKLRDNIYLDVAHNVSGAQKILEEFSKNFSKEKLILIYNSYFDKNPKEILKTLKPLIKEVQILEIKNNPRIIKKEILEKILKDLQIPFSDFKELNASQKYLVCGSFSVVGAFLSKELK